MAAPTILQIVQGIETRLKTISGLMSHDYQPDQITPPVAFVGVPSIPEYRTTFGRGRFTLEPTVTVYVSRSTDIIGQRKVIDYTDVSGPTSIPAAIEGDRTLGGIVEECFVTSFESLGAEEANLIGYFGGRFNLRVTAPGK